MGVMGWPGSYDEVAAFADAYEAERFARTEGGARTAVATRELFVGWFPRPLAPLTRTGVHALLDPPLLEAFGFEPAPAWLRVGADVALRARGRVVRCAAAPAPAQAHARAHATIKGYPDGYVDRAAGDRAESPAVVHVLPDALVVDAAGRASELLVASAGAARPPRRWPAPARALRAPGMTTLTPGWSMIQRSANCGGRRALRARARRSRWPPGRRPRTARPRTSRRRRTPRRAGCRCGGRRRRTSCARRTCPTAARWRAAPGR